MQNHILHPHTPLVASILTVLMGFGMFAQMIIGTTSAQVLTGIHIQEPTANSTWFWDSAEVVRFTTDSEIGGVEILLTKGGAVNPQDNVELVINSGCGLTSGQTVHSCNVNIPAKPQNAEDGAGYFVIVQELAAVEAPLRGIQGISMASSSWGDYGVSLGIGAADDQVSITDPFLQADLTVNPNSILPAGEKIRRARITVQYDQTKIAVWGGFSSPWGYTITYREDLSDPALGIMVLDALLTNENSYPTTNSFMLASWGWDPIAEGLATAQVTWTGAGIAGDGSDIWLSASESADTYGDMLKELDPASDSFNIVSSGVTTLAGTYLSKKFPVGSSTSRFENIQDATVVFSDNLDAGATLFVDLGFFGGVTGATNLCTANASDCATRANFVNGFYRLPLTESGLQIPLGTLNGIPWIDQTTFIQFRIFMSTADYYSTTAPQPWVQSVDFNYTAEPLGIIGGIFSGNSTILVPRGGSTPYSFVIDPNDTSDFVGTVSWAIVPIQSGASEISFVGSTGTVSFNGDDLPRTVNVNALATANAIPGSTQQFTIQATVTSDTSKAFTPLSPVTVQVTGSGGVAQFSLNIVPSTATTIVNGQSASFAITATRQSGFVGDITLSDNILSAFGDDLTAVYLPANKTLTTATTSVTLTVTAASANTTAGPRTMTITGTSGIESSGRSVDIIISDGSNLKTISLELTAPIEGGTDTVNPVFSFRLYSSANLKVVDTTDVRTTQDKATLSISNLTIGGVYKGFIRSNRHLWREGTATITIAPTQDNYSMSFTKLLAGDIDPNNVINAVDVPVLTRDWGKTQTGLLPDFDANGVVNALDIVAIVGNWFKTGATLPTGN